MALSELVRFEFWIRRGGFRRVEAVLRKSIRPRLLLGVAGEREIRSAMDRALALYWKPVLCLQRSVAEARLLRKCGHDSKVVIGCRTNPFLSHAWVEINGRAVNDSPAYRQELSVLMQL